MSDPGGSTSARGTQRFSLAGRRALVTGSSRGIGLALARGLAEAGATVILHGRDAQRVAASADALAAEGLAVERASFDVTDAAAVQRGVAPLLDQPIDILVNNVGVHDRAPLAEMTPEAWRSVIDANLTSAFLVSRTVVGPMLERGRGKIINTCSLMSEVGRPTTGNYAAAKGGLRMLTRAMAVEWSGRSVQANGIGPGYILTDLTQPLADDPEFDAWVRGRTPAGRWGTVDDLIGAAIFLASPASDFVSGQILYIDGGLLAAV